MRKRGNQWQADVLVGEKRYRRSFATAKEAELFEARAHAADLAGDDLPEGILSGQGYTLKQAFDGLASLPAVRGGWAGLKAEDTQVLLGTCALRFYGRDKQVASINTEEVDRYVSSLVTAGKASATINRRLSGLSKMLRFAHKRGYLDRLPDLARQKEGVGRVRWVTRDEEASILATLQLWGRHEVADLVVFLIDTGARLGEALNLDWKAVGKDRVTFWDTKSGSPRSVPLTRRVTLMLDKRREWAPGPGPFGVIQRSSLRCVWDRLRTHLGLHDVVIHSLRHTCASRLVQGCVDLRRVQAWMGHKTIQMTTRYAHLAPTDLDRCVGVLEKTS